MVSHAYVHLVGFDTPVLVGGLLVKPGDLLLADLHGVIQIPLEIARDIPEAVRRVEIREKTIIRYCQSPDFCADGLADLWRGCELSIAHTTAGWMIAKVIHVAREIGSTQPTAFPFFPRSVIRSFKFFLHNRSKPKVRLLNQALDVL